MLYMTACHMQHSLRYVTAYKPHPALHSILHTAMLHYMQCIDRYLLYNAPTYCTVCRIVYAVCTISTLFHALHAKHQQCPIYNTMRYQLYTVACCKLCDICVPAFLTQHAGLLLIFNSPSVRALNDGRGPSLTVSQLLHDDMSVRLCA